MREGRYRCNNQGGTIGVEMSTLQGEGLHKLEAFPLLFYLIANDGSHVLNRDDPDPSHHGLHSRGLENSHSIHNHAPRKGVEAENTLTTSDQRAAESR